MNGMKLDTSALSGAGDGVLIFAGLLVLAMVLAARGHEGMMRSFRYQKAIGQIVVSLVLLVVPYLMITFMSLGSVDRPPEKTTIQLVMFALSGVLIAQILLLAAATGNLLRSLTER
jgi:hypothetical protein